MAKSLDYWREYFRGANSDIFDIIEHSIMVAALDCPKEFKMRRDHVAELLFTCKVTKCVGCDSFELAVPKNNSDGEEEDMKCKNGEFFEVGGSKESKANSSRDDDHLVVEMDENLNQVSNFSYGDAEALTDEIEEQSQLIGEVLRIKRILDHYQDESDSVLFESLRRLQLTNLSVEILKGTEIGKSVNALKKHGSKQIRDLVRTLIEGWVVMVDEWVSATAAIVAAENTSESVKTSAIDEEEGLPSPPLDEGFLFGTDTTPIEWSQCEKFFEGMDEDGNPRNNGEFNKNRGNGRKPSLENQGIIPKRKQQLSDDSITPVKDKKVEQPMKQEAVLKKPVASVKPNKPPTPNSDKGRPIKPSVEQKVNNYEMTLQQKSEKGAIQKKPLAPQQNMNVRNREQQPVRRKPLPPQQDKSRCSDEASIQVKLEAAKRKLQERYQEAENAKRQRTIQVMELHDIPKQGQGRSPNMKPGNHNHNRHWANGRR